jgi:hypothetical protein
VTGLSNSLVTIFRDRWARRMEWRGLDEMPVLIADTRAADKLELPLLKLARFANAPNARGCLRYDANMLSISGIEADYDGEIVGFDEAVETLRRVGIASVVYTSPSHSLYKPRWHVLAPSRSTHPSAERSRFLDRLDVVFRGRPGVRVVGLSTAFFYGRVVD